VYRYKKKFCAQVTDTAQEHRETVLHCQCSSMWEQRLAEEGRG